MKILTPGTPDVPPPAELAELFTVAEPGNPAPVVIKPRAGAATAGDPAESSTYNLTNTYNRTVELKSNLEKWLSKNPGLRDEYLDYYDNIARPASDVLKEWMDEQSRRERDGEDPGPEPTTDQPKKTPDKTKPRPKPPQDTLPFGTPGETHPNDIPATPPLPRPAKHPPYTILESATQAAEWLAQRWPQDVKEQGYGAFIAARKKDVLERVWTPRYWRPLKRLDPSACMSRAYNEPDPDWEKPPFNTPGRQRSIATYSQASAPYPLPAPYTTGDQPSPSAQSDFSDEWLEDVYLAAWIETFEFDKPYYLADMAPTFLDTVTHHYVAADETPSRVQFTTYSLPFIYANDSPGAADDVTLCLFGRRYNWTTKIAPGGSLGYEAHMRRHFTQDLRVMAMLSPNEKGIADRVRIKLAPGAAMGRYFGKAREIHTEFFLEEPAAYIAKSAGGDPDNITDHLHAGCAISWTQFYLDPWGPTWQVCLDQQSWGVVYKGGRESVPLGSIAFKTTHSGYVFSAPNSGPADIYVFTTKMGPLINYLEYLDGWPTSTAYNIADFAKPGGDSAHATIWRTRDGAFHTAPGYLSLSDICDRI